MASYLLLKMIRKLPGKVIRLIPKPVPNLIAGYSERSGAGAVCRVQGRRSVLLVTDKTLYSLGCHQAVEESLKKEDICCTVFADIASEPNTMIIDAGRSKAEECGADCIIALGGGSVMDSCKMIAAGAKLKRRRTRRKSSYPPSTR